MRPLLSEALKALSIEILSCAVHERCLPPDRTLDAGCGAPGGDGAADFTAFLSERGFNAIQLGPAGQISPHNLSPYDGTAFARSRLQLSWRALDGGPLAVPMEASQPESGERCDYPRAFVAAEHRWAGLHRRWEELEAAGDLRLGPLRAGLEGFKAREVGWLRTDAVHQELSTLHGGPDPSGWTDRADARLFSAQTPAVARRLRLEALAQVHARALERYAREQYLLFAQHQHFTAGANALGLRVWADLQVGLSHADRWANESLMLEGYALGAPPSRTNPEGQPWGYPVLSPAHEAGADAFRAARFSRLFRDYDGVRVDHPHGLVCPWVYQEGTADPHQAVRDGARLFSVGNSARHAGLAAFDIARPGQLDLREQPWADGFLTDLDEAQVERYARPVDALVAAARAAGKGADAVACEALSTMPFALGRVLARHGLGRFRVTQKADVLRPDDVYLPANAVPEDWVMVGTHDTAPIWRAAALWTEAVAQARLEHAVHCLAPDGVGREAMARHFGQSRRHLAFAELAVLFTTRARHVMVWVFDLLGSDELYNRPGVVHPDNWTLRVPADWRAQHEARAKHSAAFDPPAALALALASRPLEARRATAGLIHALAARASTPLPGLLERVAR
jgi:4-alpha-glucanotransferase